MFGTDPDRKGSWGNPQEWIDSYRWLSHLGVRAPCATRRKRRYEANQVWFNTTFISQGSQSWGKLAVETWRVKTELIIITMLHIIIIITSILNLGFKTIAPQILAHTKMQGCGSVFIFYGSGSGSSGSGWRPIRIRIWIQSGSRALMTKNWKKTAEKKN